MSRNAKLVEVPSEELRKTPGAYSFVRRSAEGPNAGVVHSCPCGCGLLSALWFRGSGAGRDEWDVSGDWPNVTLQPSVGIANGHWHGWIKNGVWEEG